MPTRQLFPCRDAILQRRYAPPSFKPRRTACLWPRDPGGTPQMLTAHASQHRTRGGILYNRRARLVRRFGLAGFVRGEY